MWVFYFFFSSRRRHTRCGRDWSSDVCSSDLQIGNFDTSFRIAADYDWMLRALTVQGLRVKYLPEVLVNMQAGGVSNGSLRGLLQKSREINRPFGRNGLGGGYSLLLKTRRKSGQFFQRAK